MCEPSGDQAGSASKMFAWVRLCWFVPSAFMRKTDSPPPQSGGSAAADEEDLGAVRRPVRVRILPGRRERPGDRPGRGIHRVDLVRSVRVLVEGDLGTVGAPGRAADGSVGRHDLRLARAIRVHDEELEISVAVAVERDLLAVVRERGLRIRAERGELTGVAAVAVDRPDLVRSTGVALVDDRVTLRRDRRQRVGHPRGVVRELHGVRPVGTHRPDLRDPAHAVRLEGNRLRLGLVGADVAARALRPAHATLVGRGAGEVVCGVDRGAAGSEREDIRRAGPKDLSELRVDAPLFPRAQPAGRVVGEVAPERSDACRTVPVVAVPRVRGQQRVREGDRLRDAEGDSDSASAHLPCLAEVGLVVRDRGVCERRSAVEVQATTVALRLVVHDRAVRDGEICAEVVDAASDPEAAADDAAARCVVLDGAADDRQRAVVVDAAAGLVGVVAEHHRVLQRQRSWIVDPDPAADARVRQGASVGFVPALDREAADRHGPCRDLEEARAERVAADVGRARPGADDVHVARDNELAEVRAQVVGPCGNLDRVRARRAARTARLGVVRACREDGCS